MDDPAAELRALRTELAAARDEIARLRSLLGLDRERRNDGEARAQRARMGRCRVHCRPGGVAVFIPDHTRETFEEDTDHGGSDGADGRAVRFLEWTTDPGPADTWAQTEYAFLLREPDGRAHAVHETHRLGLFGRDDWLRLLAEADFRPHAVTEVTSEDRTRRECFIAHRLSKVADMPRSDSGKWVKSMEQPEEPC
ncbi:MAG: hypothetical protein GEV08_04865 [Acidimicrobiia bacterium]|nr:hypothetical protein [Acidimicrobiia bacterium]